MNKKLDIVLVHGTWARNAPWALGTGDSSFRKRLKEKLHYEVNFHSPNWNGRNRHEDRKIDDHELGALLDELKSSKDTDKIFIIGHSHGGNTALYSSEENNEKIQGIACMNTPFILPIERNMYPSIKLLKTSISIILIYLISIPSILLFYPMIELETSLSDNFVFFIFLFLIYGAIILLVARKVYKIFHDRTIKRFTSFIDNIIKKRDDIISDIKTPKSKIPLLSIRSDGDEVSFVLNVCRTLADLPFALAHRLLFWPICVAIMIVFQYGFVWDDVEVGDEIVTMLLSIPFTFFVGYYGSVIIVFYGFVVGLVAHFILCHLSFGVSLRNFFTTYWLQFIVTPVPIGSASSEFRCVDLMTPDLSHSAIYRSDEVIDIIANWIDSIARYSNVRN